MKRTFVIILITVLLKATAFAQVSVEAKMDSMSMLIGEQVDLKVTVTAKRGAKILFPDFKPSQQLVPGIEVLGVSRGDTSDVDNGLMAVTKRFTLTSFDEHLYAIPGMKVLVDGKRYSANQLALKVITVDVDTLHPEKFFPPKDVQDNPFLWKEWNPILWMSVLVLLICILLAYLTIRLKQNKPIVSRIRIVKKLPPHKKALDAIGKLKSERMASTDDQKAYYTQLTDALRQYIKERFGFNAMEMTSSEILHNLQSAGDRKMIDELKELFLTADLVKFAKYSTLLNENDMNLVNAVNFIDQTKIEGQPTEEKIIPTLSDDDKKTRSNRILIKTIIVVSVSAIAILLGCISYFVYLLVE